MNIDFSNFERNAKLSGKLQAFADIDNIQDINRQQCTEGHP